jgi:1-acyl-sn-glycerol-3-phosphate acyltransferase
MRASTANRRRQLVPMPGRRERLGAAWWLVIAVLYLPARALVRLQFRNVERLPPRGPAILVTNHVSHIDPFLIARMVLDVGRRPRFLAKDTIFAVPAVGAAMRGMGHIPVKRGTTQARQSFTAALEALNSGGLIVLHPEGTVTRDPEGWPMSGKSGAARLALLAEDVPVIPVAQWGVQDSIDLYKKRVRLFPRPQHVISVGEPIDLAQFRERRLGASVLTEATDVIMRRLRHDVAELRGLPEPQGELYVWKPSAAQ